MSDDVPLPVVSDDAGAEFDGRYRYRLWRAWDPDGRRLLGVLLNPSVAGAGWDERDHTVTKFMGFARRFGYGAIEIVNLYAFRTTHPRVLAAALREHGDLYAVGPRNDQVILEACGRASTVIAAWGSQKFLPARDRLATGRADVVKKILRENHPNVLCLGRTADGHPRHPLRLAYSTVPEVFA